MDLPQPPERPALKPPTPRAVLAAALACAGAAAAAPPARHIDGIVWQPSRQTLRPHGQWQRLGARHLLLQWAAVDGQSFFADAGLPPIGPELPDWQRIAREPWARDIVLGMAGLHDEAAARANARVLAAQSRALVLAAAPLPLRVSGWYFPVEIDPTWTPPADWADALRLLPRPLWLSAHDSANLGPQPLADWLARWLPPDVGVFFQDGVGVHARAPATARAYLQHLSQRLSHPRVRAIAEAFRPAAGGGFRPATVAELLPQIDACQGWPTYLFDGPHYVSDALVDALHDAGVGVRD
ncbi:MAG: hypothetical protein Q4G71_11865 [Pseudomonadota bacterium]|nr:hypothetical protein [Pseudomonadota bacterium]